MNTDSVSQRTYFYISETLENEIRRFSGLSLPIVETVTTGLRDLDLFLCGGLPIGTVSAVAGRPCIGREEFARHVAFSVARQGLGVLYFSLAHPKREVALHGLAEALDVEAFLLNKPTNPTDVLNLLDEHAPRVGLLGELPMVIDDTPALSVEELCVRAVALCRFSPFQNIPLKLLIVDSIACLYSDSSPPMDAVEEGLTMLGDLARREGVHVLCTMPVTRKLEKRKQRYPMLFDLWGGRKVERFCDPVLAIYRESYYRPDPTDDAAEIIVLKNYRQEGGRGVVRALFNSGRFGNLIYPVKSDG